MISNKLTFDFKNGFHLEILYRADNDENLYVAEKRIYGDGSCDYSSNLGDLNSFDDSHHKDYPIEFIMDCVIKEEGIPDTESFWTCP